MKALRQTEPRHALMCTEIWGGNREVLRTVELPDLQAWVYSNPLGTKSGGDVHYFSVCDQEVLSRIALADVSGHGPQVSARAETLHTLIQKHINMWNQTDFVKELNSSFGGSESGTSYATTIVLGFLRGQGEVVFANAGHPPPLWYQSSFQRWRFLDDDACDNNRAIEGLPVGLIEGTNYRQNFFQLDAFDILILYTDGITESENSSGEMLGLDGLLNWVRLGPSDNAVAAGQFLLDRLTDFRRDNRRDDETIIAIQRQKSVIL